MANRRFGVTVWAMVGVLCAASPAAAQLAACAVPIGTQLPDLAVDRQLLASQIFASEENFTSKSCSVAEGVVTKPGKQLVLRFNSSTPNIGQADMYIGDPALCPQLFEYSDCHQHLQFKAYTAYRLWTVTGYAIWAAQRNPSTPVDSGLNARMLAEATYSGDLISGHKQGVCIVDSAPYLAGAAPAKYFSCSSNQGITAGWEDVYGPQLPDQFIQITSLPEGDYVLETQVNPNLLLPESDYSNNFAAVKIHYTPRHGNAPASVQVIQ